MSPNDYTPATETDYLFAEDMAPAVRKSAVLSDESPCGRRHGERTPSRMKPACPVCDTIHCASDVVAVGRFDPDKPTGFMPRVGGCGCVYRTREEAEAVACAERVARREVARR